jgi:rhamnose transport system permease protein
MTTAALPLTEKKPRRLAIPPQQLALAALLVIEIAIFGVIGTNFLTLDNFYTIPRLNVELGLLALAMTPVIVTGGIDLSVGSLMGLAAVLFGKMWRDAHMPIPVAMIGAMGVGVLAGGLNALLITRLRIPPLIVTLGSMSLFRGVAQGITGGVDNFTNFPERFLSLGQGTWHGVPNQLPILVAFAVFFWLLLHRGRVGRELSAIGFSPEGARHAGIRVERRLALAYVLSGFVASLAAIIYAARVGQAKADAGMGYELSAITAVVLGGTSIFGGRGSILGTLLGLFAIAILQNGLRLADLPAELAGVLTGVLLLVGIGLDRIKLVGSALADGISPRRTIASAKADPTSAHDASEEFEMKNSQVLVLCVTILIAAAMIVIGNEIMVNRIMANKTVIASNLRQLAESYKSEPNTPPAGKQLTIAMMPKSKGNAYFIACQKGAEEAAKELNVNLLWDGPTDPDPAKQSEIVDTWVTRGVDAIAVAVENRDALSDSLRKAKAKGIKVITYDSDAAPDSRDFFVNQATPQGIGQTLMDDAARVMGDKGKFAIITASLTAANMNEWRKYIEERRAAKYPNIECVTVRPCDDIQSKATDEANNILNAYPDVKLIMAICSPAVPGAAEAVKQAQAAGRAKDVKVIGLGLPNENKAYIHAGVTDSIVLWKTMDLGYLTVYVADELCKGELKPGMKTMDAGKLKGLEIQGDNILLGKPFTFTKDNIDQFDF